VGLEHLAIESHNPDLSSAGRGDGGCRHKTADLGSPEPFSVPPHDE
jgi:hypothetical protein